MGNLIYTMLTNEELAEKAKKCSGTLNQIWEQTKVLSINGAPVQMKDVEAIFASLCDLADIQVAIIARLPK